MNNLILFPNQIYENYILKSIIDNYDISNVILLELPVFFGIDPERTINFNKMKLVLHRACFLYYKDYLKNLGVLNIEHIPVLNFKDNSLSNLFKKGNYYYIDVPDYLVDKRMKQLISNVIRIDDFHPSYVFHRKDIDDYFNENEKKKKKGLFHKQFYEWSRKRLEILMDEDNKPIGGSFSYDKYNRSKPPSNSSIIPKLPIVSEIDKNSLSYTQKAKKEIEKEFPNNYGNSDLYLPITFEGSKEWLNNFIDNRLFDFGEFQDAVLKDNAFMFHSVISPLLNCGLLTPRYVIDDVLNYFEENNDTLYSVEGFIRQVLGWREWQRVIYLTNYENSVSSNYYENTRRLTKHWYDGTLGVQPIDDTIKSAYKNAYLHHILRLMYMSNFMTLCKIHPDDMYYWFMSFAMDSYDWVMIQNVYGMGSFADGGKTTTKPYITTGNYIIKMSNYKKGNWSELWEGLYYMFILDNLDKLLKFPRVGGIMRKNLERKSDEKINEYRDLVDDFLFKYTVE